LDKWEIENLVKPPKVDAASPTAESNNKDKIAVGDKSDSEVSPTEGGKEISKKKTSKIGFRDRKVR
jgi:hypothetical protein